MRRGTLLLAVLFLGTTFIQAQNDKKTYTTKRVNPHPPVIDGLMNDPAWDSVPWEDNFVQRDPCDGEQPTERTSFKILYDDKHVYALIRAYDSQPDDIDCRMTRRDETEGDILGIWMDSYFDHATAFVFLVNAGGIKMDGIWTNDGENEDYSPDPVWNVKTAIDDQGWTAEMEIPLNQLRYGKKEKHVWGLEVGRFLWRKEELSLWQPIPKDAPGFIHLFGELHGIEGIKPFRRIELLPYSVGQIESMEQEKGNPFTPWHDKKLSIGLDGKIGITSDLTMDFTVNPDFGQVEADPSVVNLTAYETFFEEKRPFFIEGKNIMDFQIMLGDGDFSNDNLFYSRRIGRPASYYPDVGDNEYVRMPENSSIITAMKLSGKTKTGWSVGVMDAITNKESATIDYFGNRRQETVEPFTNYFLGSVRKDYNEGATTFGSMITHTYRDLQDSHLEFLNRNATTGGINFQHQWHNRSYFIQFISTFSHIQGTPDALLEAQTSSRRYFQRPDAEHVSVDSSRTSMTGYGGSMYFGKSGDGHINFVVGGTWRSPGLELNDMGYLRRADAIMEFAWAQYRLLNPFAVFNNFSINFNQWRGWDFSGENTNDGGNTNLNAQFKNYWSLGFGIGYNAEGLSASALRGGPALLYPPLWNYWGSLSTDSKKAFSFGLSGSASWGNEDTYSTYYSIQPRISWRPGKTFSLSINPFYMINKDDLQYVDTIGLTDSDRYIFGRINQKTLGLILRLNYAITPNLTIQYYGQPFVSAGKYTNFKRITDPRAGEYKDRFHTYTDEEITYHEDWEEYSIDENRDGSADYSIGYPDFNFREFRSNLVIRWEYNPGSTLFLVWSQGRTGIEETGNFNFGRDMRDLFNIHPHNVVLLKINKWFSL
jgi:hypothetical protein